MTDINENYEYALKEMESDEPNMDLAYEYLTKALNEGSGEATYAIATWYLHGFYLDRDIKKAFRLLTVAAEKMIPEALFDLAVCYERGTGTKKDEEIAFHLYLKAALRGDKQSIYEVGRSYYHGIGIEVDEVLANIWLDRAEELGVAERPEH